MSYQPLKYIFERATEPTTRTLLLLHGTGGDERDLLPLATRFGKGQHVLSVRGNVLENGMPRFFRRLGMGVFDEADVVFRTHELVQFLQEFSATEGLDLSQTVALGYSNGANIAGAVLMLYPELLGGAILLRPMQPLTREVPAFSTSRHQPVLLSPGRIDPTVDPRATDQYARLLATGGFEVTREDVNAGHQLMQQDVDTAVRWYQERFQQAVAG